MYLLGPYQFNVATFTNLFADSLFLRLTVDLFIVLPSGEPSWISTDTRHPNKSIILDLTLPRRYIATSYRVFSTVFVYCSQCIPHLSVNLYLIVRTLSVASEWHSRFEVESVVWSFRKTRPVMTCIVLHIRWYFWCGRCWSMSSVMPSL